MRQQFSPNMEEWGGWGNEGGGRKQGEVSEKNAINMMKISRGNGSIIARMFGSSIPIHYTRYINWS